MRLIKNLSVLLVGIAISGMMSSCVNTTAEVAVERKKELFEPADGECIVFVGQDLGAIGGLEKYSDGYVDHMGVPAGLTMYTNFRTGDISAQGYEYRGLDGIWETHDWFSGECNMELLMKEEKYKDCYLAIGLELVNHDSLTAAGAHDDLIDSLGNYLISLGERPVFLRIGYEFDGHEWNNYDSTNYRKAFRRIKDIFDVMGVDNVAYVWQSKGWGTSVKELESWYPGDEYVDWCGYSMFSRISGDPDMLEFARTHNKPVFIAEATPFFEENDTTIETQLDIPEQAKRAWDEWFTSLFNIIDENPDVVKAVSYINVDWMSQGMWKDNPPFYVVDSRIGESDYVMNNWKKEISKEKYHHGDKVKIKNIN